MLLVDSDVVVKAAKDLSLLTFLKPLRPAICTVVNIELIQGSKSKADIKVIERFIETKFDRIPNVQQDLEKALELVRRHSSASGIMLADAIIAATAINRSIPLLTFNAKHFRYDEIKPFLFKP